MSKSDGDFHYISAAMLVNLYKVKAHECIIKHNDHRDAGRDFTGLIELRPRYDGDYKVPE